MSAGVRPAFAMTCSTADCPAVSMITGSTLVVALASTRARGRSPRERTASLVPIISSAAASASAGDVPTVCRCRMLSTSGWAARASASWPDSPSSVKAGCSAANDSVVVDGRISSSRSTCVPSARVTGTTLPE